MGCWLGAESRETARLVVFRPQVKPTDPSVARHRQATGVHAAEQIVEAKAAQKPFKGGGNWIKVNRVILNNDTYHYSITPRSLRIPAGLTR